MRARNLHPIPRVKIPKNSSSSKLPFRDRLVFVQHLLSVVDLAIRRSSQWWSFYNIIFHSFASLPNSQTSRWRQCVIQQISGWLFFYVITKILVNAISLGITHFECFLREERPFAGYTPVLGIYIKPGLSVKR